MQQNNNEETITEEERGRLEWRTFFFIIILFFPILSTILIGGYGFIIWMLQMFVTGPPGHG